MIDSVSVHLVQAGTSGRTADREMFKWTLGICFKNDGKPGVRKHKTEAVWLCLVHSKDDILKAHYCTSVRHKNRDSCICVSDCSI